MRSDWCRPRRAALSLYLCTWAKDRLAATKVRVTENKYNTNTDTKTETNTGIQKSARPGCSVCSRCGQSNGEWRQRKSTPACPPKNQNGVFISRICSFKCAINPRPIQKLTAASAATKVTGTYGRGEALLVLQTLGVNIYWGYLP